jgi:hypothetical protein
LIPVVDSIDPTEGGKNGIVHFCAVHSAQMNPHMEFRIRPTVVQRGQAAGVALKYQPNLAQYKLAPVRISIKEVCVETFALAG